MRTAPSGHSLVELLVAIPIVATALLASGAGLGFGLREAHRGIARGKLALMLVQRVEQLAADAARSDSTCGAVRDGSETVDGIAVRWAVGPGDAALRPVTLRARLPFRGAWLDDSLEVRVRCG